MQVEGRRLVDEMNAPALSVVVPIYNVEPYLHSCVESLLAQTFRDLELILVDDGSTDGCSAICDSYARLDSRVRVLHKENGGLSSARNAGMAIARASYLSFIDSDDLVHPQMLESLMLSLLRNEDVGASMCAYLRISSENECDMRKRVMPDAEVVESVHGLEMVYGNLVPNIAFVAWNKIYRRDLFDRSGVRYPEGKLYEDGYTTYRLLYEAEKVAILDEPLYFYRTRPGSIVSGRSQVDERRMDEIEADIGAWDFFRDKEKSLAIASAKSLLRTCMSVWRDAGDEGYGPEAKRQAMATYKSTWQACCKLLASEPKKWVAYSLFRFFPEVVSRVFF